MIKQHFQNFDDFWVFYLGEHANPRNRVLHYIASVLALLLLLTAIWNSNYLILIIIPVASYTFAWIGHFFIEKNRPATFKYPFWSLRADFWMLFLFLTGRISRELERIQTDQK